MPSLQSVSSAIVPDFSVGAARSLPVIFSMSGLALSAQEKDFFSDSQPLGFILFARNCESPEQVKRLTASLQDTLGRACPILIDQEGGRVQRLKPPHWRAYPPMQDFGVMVVEKGLDAAKQALRLTLTQLGEELLQVGVNVDCAPVLDVLTSVTHGIIGDRAFSEAPHIVAELGAEACRIFLDLGIIPIIKHIPGHGRATADSHLELPRVDAGLATLQKNDFDPFRFVSKNMCQHQVWAMTAHILYEALDAEYPLTLSKNSIEKYVRQDIGFDGVLLSDDLDMLALAPYGTVAERALGVVKAGCDLALYCAGDLPTMQDIAAQLYPISQETLKRLQIGGKSAHLAA